MDSLIKLVKYLEDTVNLNRVELKELVNFIDQDVNDLHEDYEKAQELSYGQLYNAERELRIIRKVVNRYFKKESDILSESLPY